MSKDSEVADARQQAAEEAAINEGIAQALKAANGNQTGPVNISVQTPKIGIPTVIVESDKGTKIINTPTSNN